MQNKTHAQKKARNTFLYLSLLFIVPLLLASWMVLQKSSLSSHMTHHGQLLQPPLHIEEWEIYPKQDVAAIKKHWILLYIYPHLCDAVCEKSLYDMRQVRTAMGKDMDRVGRAVLSAREVADLRLEKLLQDTFNGTVHLKMPQKTFSDFLQKKNASSAEKRGVEGIYIVDPLGNIILFYPPATDPMGIFKDLTRLLKLSHIG